jgi:hypothetical protein
LGFTVTNLGVVRRLGTNLTTMSHDAVSSGQRLCGHHLGGSYGPVNQRISHQTGNRPSLTSQCYHLWDARLAGFGLMAETSGTKTVLVRYRADGGDTQGAPSRPGQGRLAVQLRDRRLQPCAPAQPARDGRMMPGLCPKRSLRPECRVQTAPSGAKHPHSASRAVNHPLNPAAIQQPVRSDLVSYLYRNY